MRFCEFARRGFCEIIISMNTEPIYVVKADGTKELFDVKKLDYSLRKAGASTKAVEEILSQINTRLSQEITTH